jgi:hypothetical protein
LAAPRLAWRQTYSADYFGVRFLENYGWTEFIGPEMEYPAHAHEAEEILHSSGRARHWRRDAQDWRLRAPVESIFHPSWAPHAMRTDRQPLLALYVWRAGDITQKSRIVRDA